MGNIRYTHTRLTALCPGLPGWAGTRKVKPIWILPEQETVSGSGTRWAICKSASRSKQITTPAPHRSVFYRSDALPAIQPTSKHWRHEFSYKQTENYTQSITAKCSNEQPYNQNFPKPTNHIPGARFTKYLMTILRQYQSYDPLTTKI